MGAEIGNQQYLEHRRAAAAAVCESPLLIRRPPPSSRHRPRHGLRRLIPCFVSLARPRLATPAGGAPLAGTPAVPRGCCKASGWWAVPGTRSWTGCWTPCALSPRTPSSCRTSTSCSAPAASSIFQIWDLVEEWRYTVSAGDSYDAELVSSLPSGETSH
ncbi:hypothetical protein SORBI_3002G188350 [Sorghum bicolor]|uniref:Uncharacterized protein n=1 Tax=Sorghum bicolor TaxID=4558 RepID=A0A1W0W531_SORBI|nr:hypothetical protein SORBI_3002G188350 [Sorghum bicolor]